MLSEHEEDYFPTTRRDQRAERKHASKRDRSKYKKTDKAKRENLRKKEFEKKLIKKESLLQGRVVAISPAGYEVEFENTLLLCTLRGLLKKEVSEQKNLVVVGDFVLFEKESEANGAITFVQPRHSFLSRQEHTHRRQQQLIAANIDQVLITLSVVEPPLKPALIDRYLIATFKGNMQPIILINKIDLLSDAKEERKLCNQVLACYRALKIPILLLSTLTGAGLEEMHKIMKNKSSVFAGQSGVGKSSLINSVTHQNLPTGDVAKKTRKGSHTTTFAKLVRLEHGGWCIDTPGIRSFGVWKLTKEELSSFFPDINAFANRCKYPNCTHQHEPDCAVVEAVKSDAIYSFRYDSYVKLLEEFI